jgi:hypothetical protein
MDPVAVLVWGAIGFVLLLAVLFALKAFGRLVLLVLGLAVLAAVAGMVVDPALTTSKINVVVTHVNQLIQQIKSSLGV